jgi:Amidohydrolase family
MPSVKHLVGVLASAGVMFSSVSFAASTEKFSVVAQNEIVGTLEAKLDGNATDIAYQVRNNGRGPTLNEHLVIGRDRAPTSWTIDGTTAFGGRVTEKYSLVNGAADWESQADKGHLDVKDTRLYVANDASPWSFGVYARALLHTKGSSLDAIPGGTLKLTKMRDLKVGDAKVTAYLLVGIDLTPDVLLLDSSQKLFAVTEAPEVTIRAGYEKHADELLALARSVETERLEAIQRDTAHRYEKPLRIRNVRLFDPVTQKLTEPKSVVVFGRRIASVSTYQPDEAVKGEYVVDGRGGTLVPGLHDMHSHNTGWKALFYVAAGVTNVRDMGNDNEELLELTKRIDTGFTPGPRIIRAGFLEGRSPYSARYGFIPETLPDALSDVRWYADHGYVQIKIYNSMTPDWVAPIAAEAHRLGLRVSGHVPAFMSPDRAIRDGYDEINHLNQLALGWVLDPTDDTRTPLRLTALGDRMHKLSLSDPRLRATVDLMKQHHTALDPTMVIIERLMLSRAGQVQEGDAPYLDHMPIGYQRYRKRSFVDFKSPEHSQAYVDSFERLMQILKLLHDEGIRLLPGTDDGTGFTVHRELELYVKAGMSSADVLTMATLGCAQYLGEDQTLGSITPGKLADFMLIDGDPVADISAIRHGRLVMKNDTVYFPAELYSAIGIKPFSDTPDVKVSEQ